MLDVYQQYNLMVNDLFDSVWSNKFAQFSKQMSQEKKNFLNVSYCTRFGKDSAFIARTFATSSNIFSLETND